MKLSFWTLGTPDWSSEAVVQGARRFGFAGVDLRCALGRNVSVQATSPEIEALRRLSDSNGIEIASLLAYNERGNTPGADWGVVAADLIAHVELANRLGVHNVRVNAGSPAADSDWDAYLESFAGALRRTLAETTGVTLNMQNHPGAPNVAQVVRLAEMVGYERFGVGFSPDHCIDMGEDVIEAAELAAPWVRQFHLADRERSADGKLRACLPGEGIVPNQKVLEVLRRSGFDGWVSFKWEKPTYPDLPDAEVALPHFVSYMSRSVV
ncbi:MAG TPA: sugar phosphate isomerase/epimerase family protein [Dehalococcoidia bacterium]|nr:sugar phosphate isomerase/epimerase family protein [Dehalococcoidia bacterium]